MLCLTLTEEEACLNGHKYTTTCFLFLAYLFLLQHGCWAGSLMRKACGSRQWSIAKLRSLTWCTVSHRKDEGKKKRNSAGSHQGCLGSGRGGCTEELSDFISSDKQRSNVSCTAISVPTSLFWILCVSSIQYVSLLFIPSFFTPSKNVR